MIGILIVAHGNIAETMLQTTEMILGKKPENLAGVSIDITQDVAELNLKLATVLDDLASPDGILIMADMFGGTPSNLAYSFMEEGKIEVIAGFNLPMIIQAVSLRKKLGLEELCEELETFGKKSISLASSILKGNKRQ